MIRFSYNPNNFEPHVPKESEPLFLWNILTDIPAQTEPPQTMADKKIIKLTSQNYYLTQES